MTYERPEGFENEKRDCTVRTLSLVSNIPYEKVHFAFMKVGRKDGHGIRGKNVIQKVCKILNIKAKPIKEFMETHLQETIREKEAISNVK